MKKSIDSHQKPDSQYEEYLESIVDTMREALLILDKDLRVISANKTFYDSFKVKPEQTEKLLVYELGNGQWNIPQLRKLLEEILPTHNPFNDFRVEHKFPHIGKRVMLLNARQIKARGKWRDRVLLAIEDITQYDKVRVDKEEVVRREHKAMDLIRSQAQHIEAITNNASLGLFMMDADGKTTYMNPSAERITGYSFEELRGKVLHNKIHSKHLDGSAYSLKDCPISKTVLQKNSRLQNHEDYFIRKDGSYFPVLCASSPILNNKKVTGIVLEVLDITERKQAEDKVKELNRKLKDKVNELETLIELVPVGIGISEDPQGTKINVNKHFREMLKIRPGQNASKTADKGAPNFRVLRNGAEVEGKDLPMQKAGITKKPIFNDVLDIEHQDGSIINLLSSAVPILDDNNNVRIVVGAFLDITERNRLEKQKDEFLGIASHELKTPVTSIKAYGQVLQTVFQRKGDLKAVEQLKKMDAQVNKLTILIGDLLDVTKIQSGRLQFNEENFDFNKLVTEIVDEIQLTTERHEIIMDLDRSIKYFGDRERIGQVIVNLMTNAIKYSPHSKKIKVNTKLVKNELIVSVKDYGVGIPKEKKDKVFQQFFRVSGPKYNTVPGLGLGLYISNEIVRRIGGKMWVDSAIGKGSTFYFSLPVNKPSASRKNKLASEDIKHD